MLKNQSYTEDEPMIMSKDEDRRWWVGDGAFQTISGGDTELSFGGSREDSERGLTHFILRK